MTKLRYDPSWRLVRYYRQRERARRCNLRILFWTWAFCLLALDIAMVWA